MSVDANRDRVAEQAGALLDACRKGAATDELALPLIKAAYSGEPHEAHLVSRALFGIVAEGLSDAFEPGLCDVYARLFARVFATGVEELSEEELVARSQRIRRPRTLKDVPDPVETIYVLSRVSLGADVAVTSTVVDAAKKRFPEAQVCFVGPLKNWELFAGDTAVKHVRMEYPQSGDLRQKLSMWAELRSKLSRSDAIVIDPDSRLTQLGLLPVCPEERYFFFESRSYGGEGDDSLYVLTERWLEETFAVAAKPYVALRPPAGGNESFYLTASLGVGGNLRKRVADPFERRLVEMLVARDRKLIVDMGAGGEEQARVQAATSALTRSGKDIHTHPGSFASFAALIKDSALYAGYDSAGQHVAAVSGVPALTVFAGYPSLRMFHRWRPVGNGPIEIVRVSDPSPDVVSEQVSRAMARLLG